MEQIKVMSKAAYKKMGGINYARYLLEVKCQVDLNDDFFNHLMEYGTRADEQKFECPKTDHLICRNAPQCKKGIPPKERIISVP
jgi:hypothetical protein